MSSEEAEQVRWFAEEVLPHERDLRAYVRRYSREAEVDDVVQESFLRLLRARETGTIANARAYLFRTARNAVCSVFRRPKLFSDSGLTEADRLGVVYEQASVAEQVSLADDIRLLLDAIDALPPRCREIYIFRKLQGLSQKEIAARLGLSEQTVQVQVARGARKCADFLSRHQ
jgi:RNA polymerase sigma-70 factor (ECF subfamily)